MTTNSNSIASELGAFIQIFWADFHLEHPLVEKFGDQKLVELHDLFGDIVEEALDIIDKQKITLYKCSEENDELFEVAGSDEGFYKFFVDANYCPCKGFKYRVTIHRKQYTCKHILAAKLAKVLDKFIVHEVTGQQFEFLLTQILNQ